MIFNCVQFLFYTLFWLLKPIKAPLSVLRLTSAQDMASCKHQCHQRMCEHKYLVRGNM